MPPLPQQAHSLLSEGALLLLSPDVSDLELSMQNHNVLHVAIGTEVAWLSLLEHHGGYHRVGPPVTSRGCLFIAQLVHKFMEFSITPHNTKPTLVHPEEERKVFHTCTVIQTNKLQEYSNPNELQGLTQLLQTL